MTKTAAAQAANYPFCTIEPNTGDVGVPDQRMAPIAKIGKSAQIIPTRITFVDIAGLVRGASKGEGLGNQFLANIREVDAIGMSCAASRMTTSPMSRAASIRSRMPRRSRPS